MLLPKLLRPKLYTLRNYWRGKSRSGREVFRDLVIIFFALTVMGLIFQGVSWMLTKINADPELLFLPPALPLALIFMVLFLMLILSNLVTAVGTLYFGYDLDLILASPLRPWQFFAGKLLYITLSSSWTSLVFIAPLIAAFGLSFHAGGLYYLISIVALIPYFLIPSSLAVIIGTLFVRFIPARRLNLLIYVLGLVLIAGIWIGVNLIREGIYSTQDRGQLLRLLTLISWSNTPLLPSAWVASTLQSFLKPGLESPWPFISLLFGSAVSFSALAYIIVQVFHFEAFSRAKYVVSHRRVHSESTSPPRRWLAHLTTQPTAGLMRKEGVLFIREVTSILQVILLLGMCLMYLFNLKLFGGVDDLPPTLQRWWHSFFFISNWCISAFVTTGICTRFVFPSLSLEGKSFWILQTAPLKLREVLEAKFMLWYPPIAIVTVAVLVISAITVQSSYELILMSAISGVLIAYGIVGLAVGLGAKFSNFDWEHPSQLAASFGSLVFMLSSVMLILVCIIVSWIAIFSGLEYRFAAEQQPLIKVVLVSGALVVLSLMNIAVAKVSMSDGEKAVLLRNRW